MYGRAALVFRAARGAWRSAARGVGVVAGARHLQRAASRSPAPRCSSTMVRAGRAGAARAGAHRRRHRRGRHLPRHEGRAAPRPHAHAPRSSRPSSTRAARRSRFRLDFADGSRAAFKPEQINPQTVPRKEIAAYRINRLLGFNAVPPATHAHAATATTWSASCRPRRAFLATRINAETIFDDEGFTRGEVSYWIPVIVDSHLDTLDNVLSLVALDDRRRGDPRPTRSSLMAQLSSLLAVRPADQQLATASPAAT